MVSQLLLGAGQKELSNVLFCNAALRNGAFLSVTACKQVAITSYLRRTEEVGLRRGGRVESAFVFFVHHFFFFAHHVQCSVLGCMGAVLWAGRCSCLPSALPGPG